ncbi:hypothetical protein WJX72_000770 [[Myrmecia] bisecta]|uniref:Acetyl-coenzyme A synthetase n=1 Tax=[Myrmecia] bisecta TaxID=41462 RepID=A0AAW1QNT4_9CHLO
MGSQGRTGTEGALSRLQVLAAHFGTAEASENHPGGIKRHPTLAGAEEPSHQQASVNTPYKARTGITSRREYERLYRQSVEDPAGFWAHVAEGYDWKQKWDTEHMRSNLDLDRGRVSIEWFAGGRTNICHNCLDRHVEGGRGGQACFLWEGNEPGQDAVMTYKQTLDAVCQLSNWLKSVGVKKGDRVALYMPLICELPIAMLACARIGAVHSVIFAGFSAEALAQRVQDCQCRVVITASGGIRGKKTIPLKQIVDDGLKLAEKAGFKAEVCLVFEHPAVPRQKCPWQAARDVWWREAMARQASHCPVEWVGAEDPLFLLYTSGSTGKPKGVLHTTGGYMVMAGCTTKYIFDLQPDDVYWCTADCGWITGHTYLTYGPLLNGAQVVLYEGVPNYPSPGRVWQIVEKYKVRQLYTAPTLIRSLEAHDAHFVTDSDRSSLRILGTVGEPINPRAWDWFNKVVGRGRCPITETGAAMLTPLPGAWPLRPGCATLPFFGVQPVLLDEKGKEVQGAGEGILCLKAAWPGALRTIYGDHKRFESTYFSTFKGYYFTGDGCRRDEEGYYTITGRVDDVINVSGHRVGTAEVESALQSHDTCAEAAVVGFDHPIKGQGIYAYVVLADGTSASPEVKKALVATVRSQIGAFAAPDSIHFAPGGLPKTRSGKIMRRVLRKIATKEEDQLGDTSTLADPGVVPKLLETRGK